MADVKTTDESAAGALTGAEILRIVQSAASRRVDLDTLRAYIIGSVDAFVYKGATDCSANPNYPAADAGHMYKVSVAGKIGGASGIAIAAGDMFVCLADSAASGNQATVGSSWDILRTSAAFTGGTLTSALNEAPAATLASASTVNIGAAAANTIGITGTTAITAFDSIADGARRLIIFAGALTLTHNATSLILPTGANITTAAGDVAEMLSLGSGNWRCIRYVRKDGTALSASGGAGTKTYALLTPMDSQPPASNFATLDTRNSIAVLDFDDTTEEGAFWTRILPEAAALGSGLKVTIWFMATSATSGNVRWGVKLENMNATDEDSDSFDSAVEGHAATDGTSGKLASVTLTITTIDSLTAQKPFRIWIYRDASDTTNDTVSGDAEFVCAEVWSAA